MPIDPGRVWRAAPPARPSEDDLSIKGRAGGAALGRTSRPTFTSLLRRLFGMPDYQRYVTHQHRCHPEAPVLSEKDFIRVELERKYAGGGARCC